MDSPKPRTVLATDRVGDVQTLKPESSGAVQLSAETIVLCVHRGREPIVDMFDSRVYTIAPGYFTAPYGAALHFKHRAVVPGSRNPETGFQASFIAVIGVAHNKPDGLEIVLQVDDPVQWDPFSDAECREYGHAIEALDRAAMVDPIERSVQLEPTFGRANEEVKQQSRIRGGQGAGGGKSRATRLEGPGVSALKPGNTEPNEAIRQTREDAAASASGRA